MSKRRKYLTQSDIENILFNTDSESENELSSEDDGWPREEEDQSFDQSFDPSFLLTNNEVESEEDDEEINDIIATESEQTSWTEEIEGNNIISDSKYDGGGPIHNLSVGATALQYFQLLFTLDMCRNIMNNTNKYAEFHQTLKGVKDTKETNWKHSRNLELFVLCFGNGDKQVTQIKRLLVNQSNTG